MKELKNRLAEIRKEQGITQQQLADMIGMSRRYISSIEKNVSGISVTYALLIAHALGKEIEEIFYIENTEEESE